MTKTQAHSLVQALKKQFRGHVEAEPINGHGRYRFAVTSKRFEKMPQLRRQDAIWEIVDQTLPPDAALDISIILAFAPADLAVPAEK
jgi:stress-induced morphogen